VPDWLLWLIAAGVFAVAETSSLSLVLLMFGGGAAAAAITAALGGPVLVQFLVAIVGTLVLLAGVRPIAQRHLAIGGSTETGTDALIGRKAVVLAQVDAHDGRVRLNGAEWSARAFDESQVVPVGTEVRVMKITGATAVVLNETKFLEGGQL
jgi:membrane protein implicated in regulation of membrane protease activity